MSMGGQRMGEVREDLRFALRLLRKSPGFTCVVLLTLALAIGANTALFSVVNGVLLRPPPFSEPERLFLVFGRTQAGGTLPLSVQQYAFLHGQSEPFSRLAAYRGSAVSFNLSGEGMLESVPGGRVTQPFFEVLGVSPVLGRGFLPEEDVEGGPRVVVLSHGLWQRLFGASPTVLGRSITLNREPHTIVGVAPPGLKLPAGAQLWTPLRLDLAAAEDARHLTVLGRLKPEVDPAQVVARIRAHGEQLRVSRPGTLEPQTWLEAEMLQSATTGHVRPTLLVLLGAVGMVLLIACVNLANLQLARATGRERELALRRALGARPGRIARQLLTESVLLSGMGGLLGLLLAGGTLPALVALAPQLPPLPERVLLDKTVLAFTFGLSVFTGLLFGLLPAWQASRVEPQGSLQVSAWRATSRPAGSRMRRLLVVSEVALAVILLIGASLLLKSFALLSGVEPGIDTKHVLTMKLSQHEARYGDPQALGTFNRRVLERVRALPGVEAAGFSLALPFESGSWIDLAIQQRPSAGGDFQDVEAALYRPVTGGYFDALKIGLVRGRLLDDQDRPGSPPVVVINESAARRYWPGQDPIGQRVLLGRSPIHTADPEPREIIGVVRDVRDTGLHQEPPATIYPPLWQMPAELLFLSLRVRPESLVVRAVGEPASLAAAVRREIHGVDPLQPVMDVQPMERIMSRSLGSQRFNTLLLGFMAGLALVLSAVGIYGVLAQWVSQRTHELGVRMALGATRGGVLWLVLRQAMLLVAVGVGLGVVGALGLTRLLSHLLYSVSALDPAVFVAAPAVLVLVALGATWPPARRATRVDPAEALRTE
jgi:predicted permease